MAWIINYVHESDLNLHESRYFNLVETKVPYAKIDVPSEFRYPPVRLDIQKPFHSSLAKTFKSWPLVDHAPSFPYNVTMDDGRKVCLTISAAAYFPRILSLRINVEDLVGEHMDSLEDRPEISNIRSHPEIDSLIQAVIRLIVGEPDSSKRMGYQQFPLMKLEKITSTHFSTWQEHFKQSIARVLIRNDSSGMMRDELIHDLFRKAEHFNFKSSREYMLLDKQGLLMLSSAEDDDANTRLRDATFDSAASLLEIGLVFQTFLLNYLKLRAYRPFLADFVLSRIEPWCVAPGAVLRVSVTNRKIWNLICGEFNLLELYGLLTSRRYVRQQLDDNMQRFDELSFAHGGWVANVSRGQDVEFGGSGV